MATDKQTEITILTESHDFPRTMMFNRVRLIRLGPTRLFYFGLVDDDENLRDFYTCAVDEDAITRHKADILSYVARASQEPVADLQMWQPKAPVNTSGLGLANVMLVARIGPMAEIRFYNFAIGEILEAQKTGKPKVNGASVALLRCELQLQRSMFLSLYSEPSAKNAKT